MQGTLGVIAIVLSCFVFALSIAPGVLQQNTKRTLFLVFCGISLLLNGLLLVTNPHLFDPN